MDSRGGVFVATSGNVLRYDPRAESMSPLLIGGCAQPQDLAVTGEDIPLALYQDSLQAIFAGALVPVVQLPLEGDQRGRLVSTYRDWAYILVGPSPTVLLRYSFLTKEVEKVIVLEDGAVAAICAVRGGCLVAARDTIGKIYDPGVTDHPDGDTLWNALCAVSGSVLTSVAADADSQTVYFSDSSMTYAWTNGKVVPFYPMGGRLAYRGNRVAIFSPDPLQLVQVVRPGKRAATIAAGMHTSAIGEESSGGGDEANASDRVKVECEWHETDSGMMVDYEVANSGDASVMDVVLRMRLIDDTDRQVYERILNVFRRVEPGETLSVEDERLVDVATLRTMGVEAGAVKFLRWSVLGARDASFMDRLDFAEKIELAEGASRKLRLTLRNGNEFPVEITCFRVQYQDKDEKPIHEERRKAAVTLDAAETRDDIFVEMWEEPAEFSRVTIKIEYAVPR